MTTRFFLTSLPGGHSEWVPPDPIPNSEVKTLCADDSVGSPHVKVGHCQAFILTNPSPSGWGFLLAAAGYYTSKIRILRNITLHQPQPPTYLMFTTYLRLLGASFCWACNSVLARLAVGEVSPLLIVSLRWFGAVVLILTFAGNAISRDWPTLKRNLPALFLMGAFGFAVFNALLYVAAHTTGALNIGIIQGSIPVFILLGAYLVFGVKASWLQFFGVVATIIGVCMVASTGDLQRLISLSFNHGDHLMIIACLLYSTYALGLRYFRDVSPLSLFAVFATAAFIASIPLSYAEYAMGNLQWPTPKGWGIVVFITVLPSFFAQIWFIRGVSDIGAGRAGIFVNLVPVFAAILAVSILHEPFQWYHGAALTLVLVGIGLSERHRKDTA